MFEAVHCARAAVEAFVNELLPADFIYRRLHKDVTEELAPNRHDLAAALTCASPIEQTITVIKYFAPTNQARWISHPKR